MLMSIIIACIVGLAIGAAARAVLPGAQNLAIWETMLIGILGSFLGSWIAYNLLGYGNSNGGIQWIPILIGIAIAAGLIVLYQSIRGRARTGV